MNPMLNTIIMVVSAILITIIVLIINRALPTILRKFGKWLMNVGEEMEE